MRRLHRGFAAIAAVVIAPLTTLVVLQSAGNACCDHHDEVVISINGTICWESTDPQRVRSTEAAPTDSIATVTVSLSHPTTVPVTVTFNTADGTAVAPDDYEAVVNLQVTIPAGQRAVRVPVTIRRDEVQEPDEWFAVSISKPSLGRIGNGRARVIIRDHGLPTYGR